MKLNFCFGDYFDIYVLAKMLSTNAIDLGMTLDSLDKLYDIFKSKKL